MQTLKTAFTASLLDVQHEKSAAEENATSSLVASLGKALNGIPPPIRRRQVVRSSTLTIAQVYSECK